MGVVLVEGMDGVKALLARIADDDALHGRFVEMLAKVEAEGGAMSDAARGLARTERCRLRELTAVEHQLYGKLLGAFANALATMPSGIETVVTAIGSVAV
jgi:hypothetical protein